MFFGTVRVREDEHIIALRDLDANKGEVGGLRPFTPAFPALFLIESNNRWRPPVCGGPWKQGCRPKYKRATATSPCIKVAEAPERHWLGFA
jgi:hypothetical protein